MRTPVTDFPGLRRYAFILTLCYPLMLHIAIVNGYTGAAILALLTVSTAYALLLFLSKDRRRGWFAAALALAAFACFLLGDDSLVYLPPILISGALLYSFGRSLLPGKEPLISRLARHIDGIDDAPGLRYTRRLTVVWSVFFALMLLETLFLPVMTTKEVWSLFTNFINYLLILALFLGEFVFRLVYLRRRPSARAIL